VVFTGLGSTDDVGVANYTWTFTYNGTARVLYGPAPDFRYYVAGNYTVTLTVSDAAGNSATDTLIVRITERPAPVDASPGNYWWIIIVIVAVLVTIIIIWMLMRRGRTPVRIEPTDPEVKAEGGGGETPSGGEPQGKLKPSDGPKLSGSTIPRAQGDDAGVGGGSSPQPPGDFPKLPTSVGTIEIKKPGTGP